MDLDEITLPLSVSALRRSAETEWHLYLKASFWKVNRVTNISNFDDHTSVKITAALFISLQRKFEEKYDFEQVRTKRPLIQ